MKRFPRMADWWIYALLMTLVIGMLAPQQLPVSLYKLNLIALAAVSAYWLDRSMFPYARPDSFACGLERLSIHMAILYASAMLRRALIVAAAMLAVGLGA